MLPLPAGREASAGVAAWRYERQPLPASCLPWHSYFPVHHRPERTLLYQLVEDYYPRSRRTWRRRERRCQAMSSESGCFNHSDQLANGWLWLALSNTRITAAAHPRPRNTAGVQGR